LPEHYVLGFDEQRIETEGIPERLWTAVRKGEVAQAAPEARSEKTVGYPVYLNGVMKRSGWWYYFLLTLLYKVPEGTWALVVLSLPALAMTIRTRLALADTITLWVVPVVVTLSMSFLTDINLGLRYVLPIAPFVFIVCGSVASWIVSPTRLWKGIIAALAVAAAASTVLASAMIHPNYISYFNWTSGGPDRSPARLIDSNLDWGQDLVALQKWWKETIPGQPIGLAYFGQINPSIFQLRGEPFQWFLPPVRPGTTYRMIDADIPGLVEPAPALKPGYYAASASLVYGLPWRLYDSAPPQKVPAAWGPAWNAYRPGAFTYFQNFEPIDRIGHSIYIYRLDEQDVARVASTFENERVR
jgi:hypothetical protein